MATIAFTYDVSTPVGRVRMFAGDTDGTGLNRTGGDRTRTDAEILALLAQNGNDVRASAADLLEARAAEYAQDAVRSDQGQVRQDFTLRVAQCLAAAKALRANVVAPLAQTKPEPQFTLEAMEQW